MKPGIAIGLLAAALLCAACSRKPVRTSTPRAPSALELAEDEFRSGSYGEAARQYERYLNESPGVPDRDRALFRAALSHALAGPESWAASRQLFEKLVADHPGSPFAAEAGFILRLRSELESASTTLAERDAQVKKLSGELERLKKIDLERPRIRPPE